MSELDELNEQREELLWEQMALNCKLFVLEIARAQFAARSAHQQAFADVLWTLKGVEIPGDA